MGQLISKDNFIVVNGYVVNNDLTKKQAEDFIETCKQDAENMSDEAVAKFMDEYIRMYFIDYSKGEFTDKEFRRMLKRDRIVTGYIEDVDSFVDAINRKLRMTGRRA